MQEVDKISGRTGFMEGLQVYLGDDGIKVLPKPWRCKFAGRQIVKKHPMTHWMD